MTTPKSTYEEHAPVCSMCDGLQTPEGYGLGIRIDDHFYPLCEECADYVDDHMYRVIGPDHAQRNTWFLKQIKEAQNG